MLIKIISIIYVISIIWMIYEYKHAYIVDNDFCEDDINNKV